MSNLFRYAYEIRFTGGTLEGLTYSGERSGSLDYIPQKGFHVRKPIGGSPYVYTKVEGLGPV